MFFQRRCCGDGEEQPQVTLLRTRCCQCNHPFQIRPSLSMQMGRNTGHASCPNCKTFLHVEILEGDEAWTEPWDQYVQREKYGPGPLEQHAPPA